MTQPHIFDRLRALETQGQSLNALIAEACDVGDELVAALTEVRDYYEGRKPYDFHRLPNDQRANEAFDAWQQIAAWIQTALARAYADNGHTPDNGAKAA
jgi:hypothetical protein